MDTIKPNAATVTEGRYWHERVNQLVEIAFVDEGDACAIDQWGLYLDPETANVSLLRASCDSDWDGNYTEYQFDHLPAAIDALAQGELEWPPSLMTCCELMSQVIDWMIAQIANQQGGETCQQTPPSSSSPGGSQ